MKGIHIFKTGQHTDSNGTAASFSESVLKASAGAYDPKIHEAPIVIGHPKSNGPAWGWITGMAFGEDGLTANPDQVDADFEEMVEKGRFKKVSASFYQPDSPNNPVPGVYYLRHVGFLGAQPPAIKGLKDIEFKEDEEGVVEFAASMEGLTGSVRVISSVFRKLREFIIDKFSREEADEVISSWALDDLEYMIQEQEGSDKEVSPAFSEGNPQSKPTPKSPEGTAMDENEIKAEQERLAAEKKALKDKETSFSEREAKVKATEKALAIKAISADLDQLVKEGKVLPAQQASLAEFMSTLDDEKDVVAISFNEQGEGEDKKKHNQRAFMHTFLNSLPKLVEFKEVSADTGEGDDGDTDDSQELASQALSFQESEAKKGRNISITDAVNAVVQGKNKAAKD